MTTGRRIQLAIKQLIDAVASAVGLFLLSPLLLLIALAVKLTSKGPVLFRQERIGKDGRAFRICKFRTMVDGAINVGMGIRTAADDPRITRVGRLLRRLSLDELPQLLNVLGGSMSLVGPRPTIPEQVAEYGPFERRRLEMKPGITGWASVNGRTLNPWPVRIRLDVEYVDRFSLWMDLKILLRTVVVVVKGEGVYRAPDGTPPAA